MNLSLLVARAVLCSAVCCVLCAVLCCAVLCCAVLCCAVLCCAVLCCDVLCAVCCTVGVGFAGITDSDYGTLTLTHFITSNLAALNKVSLTYP